MLWRNAPRERGLLSINVIASQRVSAKRRSMTGSAKQSILLGVARWIASSQGLLAMTDYAVFAAFNPSRASTASRIRNFCTFPVTVIGNSSTNST